MSGWQNEPFAIEVKTGETKAFCTCGLSKNGPYCDGSHEGTGKTPEVISFDEDKVIYVCGCRKSSNQPFCYGSHSK